ncbi:MAG: serine/threonine-protein kinase [Mucilaginibacter sp.]
MSKVFTITDGLENMGALRTGGQGSVYKGRRIGEIFVAVKLLPTPIHAESDDDKNYKDFINEVEKLKKVNENPTPHVVKILNSGITESGSLPFIEMEFIEGPDLGELLSEPHDPVFTIHEIIKVAGQLASALSHCHHVSVKHGDIKSNNVKFNIRTGNYVLLDFGLAIMSDEQRRDSLRNAGAVEFMAPEQNEGVMLPQSDIYSYGIILYELLAGVVPFPLNNNGQSSRNNVMIAHMEMPVPDVLELRNKNMPQSWGQEKRDWEMHVPEWLLTVIARCLEKDPANRFADGTELHEAILVQNSALAIKNDKEGALVLQNENLTAAILQEQEKTENQQQQISRLKEALLQKDEELAALKSTRITAPVSHVAATRNNTVQGLSKAAVLGIGLLLVCIGAFAGHAMFPKNVGDTQTALVEKPKAEKTGESTVEKDVKKPVKASVKLPAAYSEHGDVGKIFTLFTTYAYFHDRPDAATVRKANINRWNNARLKALDDENGFIYVVYENDKGQVSKGWLNKKNLIKVGDN